MAVIKYIERNAVRAKLVHHCEDWQWGSAWRRINGTTEQSKLLGKMPAPLPDDYIKWINTVDKIDDLKMIRASVNKSIPYGRDKWVDKMVTKYHLESVLKTPGRPKKSS